MKWALISTNESPNSYCVWRSLFRFAFESYIVRAISFHDQQHIIRTLLWFYSKHKHSTHERWNGVYLEATINVQSQLIVEKGPFQWIFLLVVAIWVRFLRFIVHFSCDISHDNRTRIHTTKGDASHQAFSVIEYERMRETERKGTKKTSTDLIVARSTIVLFRFPLFAVERYCFRVIRRCRDTFNIRSSVCICQSNGSFTCTIALILLMTNAEYVKLFPAHVIRCINFTQLIQLFERWETIFLTLSFETTTAQNRLKTKQSSSQRINFKLHICHLICFGFFRMKCFCYGKQYFVVSFELQFIGRNAFVVRVIHISAC